MYLPCGEILNGAVELIFQQSAIPDGSLSVMDASTDIIYLQALFAGVHLLAIVIIVHGGEKLINILCTVLTWHSCGAIYL